MGVKSGHRTRQAEETKRQVATAARRLFAKRGYLGTTVAAISEAADIPEQTIYSAFGGKARILERITAQWMADADTAALAEKSHQAAEPAERLRVLAAINRRQLEAGCGRDRHLSGGGPRRTPKMAQTMQRDPRVSRG